MKRSTLIHHIFSIVLFASFIFPMVVKCQSIGLSLSPKVPLTSINTDSAVQISMYQDSLFLAWVLDEGTISNKVHFQVLDTTGNTLVNAHPYLDENGDHVTSNGPPSWFETDEKLFLLWTDINDTIYYSRFEGQINDTLKFSDPKMMPGVNETALLSLSTPRAVTHGDSLLIVWQASGSQSVSYGLTAYDNGNFSDINANPIPESNTASAVSVITLKDTSYVAHRGITGDEQLYFTRFANSSWSNVEAISGYESNIGPSIGLVDSTLVMFYKGATGDTIVYHGQYDKSNGTWPEQTPAFGIPGASQSTSFATFGGGRKLALMASNEFLTLNSVGILASWMSNRWDQVRDKRLTDLVIPGSHDAGMYTTDNCSPSPSDVEVVCAGLGLITGPFTAAICEIIADEIDIGAIETMSTQTQVHDFTDQLSYGYRYFDLRPDYTDNGFYAGHFCTAEGIIVGCQGDELATILSQVNGFLTNNAEVVTIKLSHYYQSGADFSPDTTNTFYLDSLYKLVTTQLGDNLFSDTSNLPSRGGKIQNLTLEEILGTSPTSGKAIVVLDQLEGWIPEANNVYTNYPGIFHYIDYTDPPLNPMPYFFFEVFDSFAGTDVAHLMAGDQTLKLLEEGPDVINDKNALFLFSWTLTQQPIDIFDGPSILTLATVADGRLPGAIHGLISSGVIKNNLYPNILFTDYSNPFSASVAVQLTGERLSYQAANPGGVINEVNHNPSASGSRTSGRSIIEESEFVEIAYKGKTPQDLQGYSLKIDGEVKHKFEGAIVLRPGQAIVLTDELDGMDNIPPCALVINTSLGPLGLGNDQGQLELVNAEGRVIDRFEYTMADVDNHASFTRPRTGGSFVRHTELGEEMASPGTDETGQPFIPCVEFGSSELTIQEGTDEGFNLVNTVEIIRHGISDDFSIVQVTANDELSNAIGGTTADGNVDYQNDGFPHTIAIIPGVNESEVLQLWIRADTLIEETDTLVLELSTPHDDVTLGTIRQTYLFIENDDSVTVGLDHKGSPLQVLLYPNPATQEVVLNWSGLSADFPKSVQLLDVGGRQVAYHPWDTEFITLDLSQLEAGLYFLQIETKLGKSLSKRLLVR